MFENGFTNMHEQTLLGVSETSAKVLSLKF